MPNLPIEGVGQPHPPVRVPPRTLPVEVTGMIAKLRTTVLVALALAGAVVIAPFAAVAVGGAIVLAAVGVPLVWLVRGLHGRGVVGGLPLPGNEGR